MEGPFLHAASLTPYARLALFVLYADSSQCFCSVAPTTSGIKSWMEQPHECVLDWKHHEEKKHASLIPYQILRAQHNISKISKLWLEFIKQIHAWMKKGCMNSEAGRLGSNFRVAVDLCTRPSLLKPSLGSLTTVSRASHCFSRSVNGSWLLSVKYLDTMDSSWGYYW